jgi:hypothetical protein
MKAGKSAAGISNVPIAPQSIIHRFQASPPLTMFEALAGTETPCSRVIRLLGPACKPSAIPTANRRINPDAKRRILERVFMGALDYAESLLTISGERLMCIRGRGWTIRWNATGGPMPVGGHGLFDLLQSVVSGQFELK